VRLGRAAQAGAATPSHAVLEQAAHWYACLRDGNASVRQQAAWRAWVSAADSHATAWQYVEDISRAFEPVRSLPNPRDIADQLRAVDDRMRARRRVLAGVALLGSGGLIGALCWRQAWLPGEVMALAADIRTAKGEQRRVLLDDGTTLWLNTASAVDIRFTAQERRIVLLTGEAFVETARDERPLLVQTRQGSMRALGTRFNVLSDGSATRLAVYGGAVEIRTAATDASRIVEAGQQASFTAHGIGQDDAADGARLAWTQGSLLADNLPLRRFAQELGRYRKGHLGVADSVADLVVYGSFPAGDSDRALQMIASALPVRIEQTLPWWTTIEARR
jgi:transmembrane sensor